MIPPSLVPEPVEWSKLACLHPCEGVNGSLRVDELRGDPQNRFAMAGLSTLSNRNWQRTILRGFKASSFVKQKNHTGSTWDRPQTKKQNRKVVPVTVRDRTRCAMGHHIWKFFQTLNSSEERYLIIKPSLLLTTESSSIGLRVSFSEHTPRVRPIADVQ